MDDTPPDDDPPSADWFAPKGRRDVTEVDPPRDPITAPHPVTGEVAAAFETGRRVGYNDGYNVGFTDGRAAGARQGNLVGRNETIAALAAIFREKYGAADRGYVNVVAQIRAKLKPP